MPEYRSKSEKQCKGCGCDIPNKGRNERCGACSDIESERRKQEYRKKRWAVRRV